MAQQIENRANKMEQHSYEFVTFSITGSANAIPVFRSTDQDAQAPSKEN